MCLYDGCWTEGHDLFIQKLFELFPANIVLVHCTTGVSDDDNKALERMLRTDNRIRRIQDQEEGRQVRHRDRAVRIMRNEREKLEAVYVHKLPNKGEPGHLPPICVF